MVGLHTEECCKEIQIFCNNTSNLFESVYEFCLEKSQSDIKIAKKCLWALHNLVIEDDRNVAYFL
jgi:hypothetical protein